MTKTSQHCLPIYAASALESSSRAARHNVAVSLAREPNERANDRERIPLSPAVRRDRGVGVSRLSRVVFVLFVGGGVGTSARVRASGDARGRRGVARRRATIERGRHGERQGRRAATAGSEGV